MVMLNRKWRSDATWNKLTGEQKETVDGWLFDERLGYAEILARVEKEFGLKSSVASLSMYYRRRATGRQGWEMVEAWETARQINGLAGDEDEMLAAALRLTGKAVMRTAIEQPDQLDALVSLTKVLLEGERNDLRRDMLRLLNRKFNYEAAEAALKDMPQFRAFLKSVEEDPNLSAEQKTERIKEFLFEWNRREEAGDRAEKAAREKARQAAEKRMREEVERREEKERQYEEELKKNPEAYKRHLEYKESVKRYNEEYRKRQQESLAAEKKAK